MKKKLVKKDLCVKIKITRCLQNEKERQKTYTSQESLSELLTVCER